MESPETNKFFEKNFYDGKKATSQSSLPEEKVMAENFYFNKKYGFTPEKIQENIDKNHEYGTFFDSSLPA